MVTLFLRKAAKTILISINVLAALLLIAGCHGSLLNPEQYWFMGYFTLAAFYLFLINVGFLLFWLFAKPWVVLISLLAIFLCWGPITNILPARFSSSFSQEKKQGHMRVMNWNVEHFDILEHKSHPERKQEMIDMIRTYAPDIACFQEMVASDSFPSAINYMPDFTDGLQMNHVHFSFNPKLDFDKKHHFGIVIFSRYPIINKKTISYSPNDYNSIFQYADIVKEGDTFRVFNIHLQSLRFSGENRRYIEDPTLKDENDLKQSRKVITKFRSGFLKRARQSDLIREEIDKSPYPVIVCGDFNDVPNSYAYNKIGRGLKDVFVEKGIGIGRTFYSISPTLRIDNIFADPAFSVGQYLRIHKKISDHFPIIADLQFHRN